MSAPSHSTGANNHPQAHLDVQMKLGALERKQTMQEKQRQASRRKLVNIVNCE